MRIVFATTQGQRGSTVLGRVLPLASLLSERHEVHALLLRDTVTAGDEPRNIHLHTVGEVPYRRTGSGKARLHGLRLVLNMLATGVRAALKITRLTPDRIIIVKPLPANVLGVLLAKFLLPKCLVILDVDDFELAANKLGSFVQRAAIHASERTALRLARHVTAATPFLADHLALLSSMSKKITLLPTGIPENFFTAPLAAPVSTPRLLYIGSISHQSGHRTDLLPAIFEAVAKKIPAATLSIVGEGDDVVSMKQAFADRGLTSRVEWYGRFALHEVSDLLRGVSIIIDPIDASLVQRAKSSFRAVVAAGYGLAYVSSDIGVLPYFFPARLHAKFFAQPASPHAYAAKIIDLIHTPLTHEERTAMREHARRLSWPTLATEFEKLIA